MLSAIIGLDQHAPPSGWTRPDFIEEQQWPFLWLKKNRIPAGKTLLLGLHTIGHLDRRCPRTIFVARRPNADILILLARSAKPRRDQTVFAFRDGRRVATWKRR